MPGLKSAAIGVWVGAGGRHERPEQNGIAHFLEHMAFKGTKTRSAVQIAEAIEDVGGYINAYTSREATAYYVRLLEDDVPLGLEVVSDILLNPIFDAREIEVERGVILQEIGQALDTPDDVIFDWLQEQAYPDQPLGRSILGPEERVKAFSREDLSAFISEHYVPGQMILSAAGAVDHDQIVAQAEALFGHLPSVPLIAPSKALFKGGEYRRIKDLEQAHFTLGFDSPDYQGSEIYTAQIYSVAFGGGMSSRLFQEVREKRGLCYSIFAQTGAYADSGMTTIYAGTGEDQFLRRACVASRAPGCERCTAEGAAASPLRRLTPTSRHSALARPQDLTRRRRASLVDWDAAFGSLRCCAAYGVLLTLARLRSRARRPDHRSTSQLGLNHAPFPLCLPGRRCPVRLASAC